MLDLAGVQPLLDAYGREAVTAAIRIVQTQLRDAGAVATATESPPAMPEDALVAAIERTLQLRATPSLRRVINLTGTVLHTNLGRAALPAEAIEAMVGAARYPSNLEFDLATGKRGDRDAHVEELICELTGAEAATIVTNNAAAVMLVVNTFARGRQVLISRGELVEIGGSFRIPEVMARAGSRLVEVGTTNRTHVNDFRAAIGPRTGLLMKVHHSNFAMDGFVASAPEIELAALAHASSIPFAIDLGSGTLVDLERYGLPHEATAAETLAGGADIVTFSGDKLLGGPQAGIIVGRKECIARIKRNPMKRALRMDKISIAALSAVLALYRDPSRLAARLPTLRLLTRSKEDIGDAARRLQQPLQSALGEEVVVSIVDCQSLIGSGSLPSSVLPSFGLAVRFHARKGSASALQGIVGRLRALPLPIIGRVQDDSLILDLRCLEDEADFIAQLRHLAAARSAQSA